MEPTPEQTEQIGNALAACNKIEAIKLYRQISGRGLKESKEFIEKLSAELRAKDPVRFPPASGKGCLVILLAIFLAVALCATAWWL